MSFVSAGSRHWQSGSFEVSKADDGNKDETDSPPISALRVTILSELEGVAYIHVAIRDLSKLGCQGNEQRFFSLLCGRQK